MDAQGFWGRAAPVETRPGPDADGTEGVDEMVLASARDARDLIAEAKHVVMERHHLDADQAFELMRLYSRSCDRPLRDVALKITHGTWLPGT